jgi:hypothetical protein
MTCPKTMIRRLCALTALGAIAMLAANAQAADGDNIFSLSGFGTIGATHSSSNDGDYVGTLHQTEGAGFTHNWNLGVDSKLGVQLDGNFTEQLSGVVQVVAQDQSNNTFSPRIEWANLQYAFTPDLKVRVGRTALPTLITSDSRLVGYTYTWIRPPLEIYNMNPTTNSDGIDASYRTHFGNIVNTVQAFDGRISTDIVSPSGAILSGATATQLQGISDNVEYGALTARAALMRTNVSMNIAPGFTLTPEMKVANLGVIYDPGSWFVQSELSRFQSPGITPDEKAFYITAGYRLNNFTPYATYSQIKPNGAIALLSYDQKTSSLGVRWDILKSTDVKLQWDHVSLGTGNDGFFTNAQPGLAGSSVNVVGVVVDFVF